MWRHTSAHYRLQYLFHVLSKIECECFKGKDRSLQVKYLLQTSVEYETLSFYFLANGTKCIALRFINNEQRSFRLMTNLKPGGYFISKTEWRIKMTFKHPSLYHFITFKGKDPTGLATVLLDGDESISVTPQFDCSSFIDVDVTFTPSKCNVTSVLFISSFGYFRNVSHVQSIYPIFRPAVCLNTLQHSTVQYNL